MSLAGQPSAAGAHSAQPGHLLPSAGQGQTAHEILSQVISRDEEKRAPTSPIVCRASLLCTGTQQCSARSTSTQRAHCCRCMFLSSVPLSPSADHRQPAWALDVVNHNAKYEQRPNCLASFAGKPGQSAQALQNAQHEPKAGERLISGAIILLFCLLRQCIPLLSIFKVCSCRTMAGKDSSAVGLCQFCLCWQSPAPQLLRVRRLPSQVHFRGGAGKTHQCQDAFRSQ